MKFTAANGATCTAVTDAKGVASCTMEMSAAGEVTAEFQGKTESAGIDLVSAAMRNVR